MDKKLNTVIIYSDNSHIVSIIKQDLKSKNIKNIIVSSKKQDCIKELKNQPAALLILDWALGSANICEILDANQQDGICSLGKRAIWLFSTQELEPSIIEGVALEYGISLLHIGELSAEKINLLINKLVETDVIAPEIQQALIKAYEAKKSKKIDVAVEVLQNLNKQYPKESNIACELAEIYFSQNQLDNAKQVLEPFVEREIKNPRALNIYGRILLKEKKFDQATIYLQRASIINPNNINRLLRLANAYLQIGKPLKAKENFEKTLELDSKNKQAIKGMGQSLLMAGELNEALNFLRQLSGPSEMASVFNAAAIIAIKNERYTEGVNLYQTAIKIIGAEHINVLSKLAFNIALAHYKNNNLDLAFYFIYLATKLDPQNAKANNNKNILVQKVPIHSQIQKYLDSVENLCEALFLNDISTILITEDIEQQEDNKDSNKLILEEDSFEEENIIEETEI